MLSVFKISLLLPKALYKATLSGKAVWYYLVFLYHLICSFIFVGLLSDRSFVRMLLYPVFLDGTLNKPLPSYVMYYLLITCAYHVLCIHCMRMSRVLCIHCLRMSRVLCIHCLRMSCVLCIHCLRMSCVLCIHCACHVYYVFIACACHVYYVFISDV